MRLAVTVELGRVAPRTVMEGVVTVAPKMGWSTWRKNWGMGVGVGSMGVGVGVGKGVAVGVGVGVGAGVAVGVGMGVGVGTGVGVGWVGVGTGVGVSAPGRVTGVKQAVRRNRAVRVRTRVAERVWRVERSGIRFLTGVGAWAGWGDGFGDG